MRRKSHHYNQAENLNNLINGLEIDQINYQIERAVVHRNKLIKNIYNEYEYYLKLVRDILFVSVQKGVQAIYYDSSKINKFPNNEKIFALFDKKISSFINSQLPLITIEQLKISGICKNTQLKIDLDTFEKNDELEDYQKFNYVYQDNFISDDTLKFQINDNRPFLSEYYQSINDEKLLSIDLDNNDNYFSNHEITEEIGLENLLCTSFFGSLDEANIGIYQDSEKLDIYNSDFSNQYQNINSFNLIDKALSDLLMNFSYMINLELFRSNLIKKIISKDTFMFLANKKFLIKYPHPFVINFEFNSNHMKRNVEEISSIYLFNITNVELEFKNLNLSMQRNKINELKNQFKLLIKKERYWKQKELNLNKIN